MLQYSVVSRNRTTEDSLYLCLYTKIILWFIFYKLFSFHIYTLKAMVIIQITLRLSYDVDDDPQINADGTRTNCWIFFFFNICHPEVFLNI